MPAEKMREGCNFVNAKHAFSVCTALVPSIFSAGYEPWREIPPAYRQAIIPIRRRADAGSLSGSHQRPSPLHSAR